MDRDTLVFLLSGGHLDMPERINRGLWPHPPLKLTEVIEVLAECISDGDRFPHPSQPADAEGPVQEGGTVQRINPCHFVYRAQRAHPLQPRDVAQTVETIFFTAGDAARHYARWDLGLPGELDGWKVLDE